MTAKQITIDKEKFTHQWFFLQHFFPKEQRKEIIAFFMNNREQIDSQHDMEIVSC